MVENGFSRVFRRGHRGSPVDNGRKKKVHRGYLVGNGFRARFPSFPLLLQCVHVIVQDPSLVVICASHKGLSLLLCADVEGLVVDTLKGAFDHCHLPFLSRPQGRVCTARCSLRSFYPRQSRRCEVLPLLHCVRRAFHQSDKYILWSKSHEFSDAMPNYGSSLNMGPGNFLLKLRNNSNKGNLLLSTSCS